MYREIRAMSKKCPTFPRLAGGFLWTQSRRIGPATKVIVHFTADSDIRTLYESLRVQGAKVRSESRSVAGCALEWRIGYPGDSIYNFRK